MKSFSCPYLENQVELTEEREQHIINTHPETLPNYFDQLSNTLVEPDLIRRSDRDPSALLFSKWFSTIRRGRFLVVVVISSTESNRNWIITTYTTRKITGGSTIWKKT